MKFKIKFQNIFVVLSILFIFGCICFYGYRLVKYYKIFNPKTEDGEKTEIISATIRKDNPVIAEGDGLYIYNGDFIFKGEKVDNYVKYNDKLWRIVYVKRSGSVKLVLDESLIEASYDKESKEYSESQIHNYLNDEKKLDVNEKKLDKITICLDKIDDVNKLSCKKTISEYVSLLSIDDYVNSINSSTNKSYINSKNGLWLYNQTSDNLVWMVKNGFITTSKIDNIYEVRPVIILKNNAYIKSGEGSKAKPYIVKDGE